jgi:hypothetical protein
MVGSSRYVTAGLACNARSDFRWVLTGRGSYGYAGQVFWYRSSGTLANH